MSGRLPPLLDAIVFAPSAVLLVDSAMSRKCRSEFDEVCNAFRRRHSGADLLDPQSQARSWHTDIHVPVHVRVRIVLMKQDAHESILVGSPPCSRSADGGQAATGSHRRRATQLWAEAEAAL